MAYPTGNQSLITIFSVKTNQVVDIKIGNIRMDKGNISNTNTSLYPTYLESLALDMPYKSYGGKYRAMKITVNTLTFIKPCYLNK